MRNKLPKASDVDLGPVERPPAGPGSRGPRGPYMTQKRRMANLNADLPQFQSAESEIGDKKENSGQKSAENKPKKPLKFNRLTENIVNSCELWIANKYEAQDFISKPAEVSEFSNGVGEVVQDLLDAMEIRLSAIWFYTFYLIALIASFGLKKVLQFIDVKNRFLKRKAAAQVAAENPAKEHRGSFGAGVGTAEKPNH